MEEVHPNSILERIQRECRDLENRYKQTVDLLALSPEGVRTDHLVQLYFEYFEKTYHILHQPTFWGEI